jgi:hypothetical protein
MSTSVPRFGILYGQAAQAQRGGSDPNWMRVEGPVGRRREGRERPILRFQKMFNRTLILESEADGEFGEQAFVGFAANELICSGLPRHH